MVILSYEFALAFLVFFTIYWLCYRSIKLQNFCIIAAGIGFLATWNWLFLLSIFWVWIISQSAILLFARLTQPFYRKITLLISLLLLVGHLCFFKYANFTILQLNQTILSQHNLNPLDIIMPLGISFYTFQAISYVVDVYKQKINSMPSAILLGFLTFVPTITAGPIFRAKDASPQWQGKIETALDSNSIALPRRRYVIQPYLAMTLIIFALFKKIVLAGWLESLWVTPVFSNPLQFNGLEVLTAVYAYSLQLFFDFSGYTDLAIALGLLLGFRLPENFNQPYLATDIQDFWNRWHITLSTWIRDYIYIPLGGNRGSFWRVQTNLMIAFLISGVWHGAGWNFLLWGAIHGIALVWLNICKRNGVRHWLTKRSKALAVFITFHYVAFGWIFFRSESFEQATQMLQALTHYQDLVFSLSAIPTLVCMLLAWLLYPYLKNARMHMAKLLGYLPWWSLPILLSLYVVIIFSLAPEGLPGFIYANF